MVLRLGCQTTWLFTLITKKKRNSVLIEIVLKMECFVLSSWSDVLKTVVNGEHLRHKLADKFINLYTAYLMPIISDTNSQCHFEAKLPLFI